MIGGEESVMELKFFTVVLKILNFFFKKMESLFIHKKCIILSSGRHSHSITLPIMVLVYDATLSSTLSFQKMVILSLIVTKAQVKARVKDKRVELEAFGSYVECLIIDHRMLVPKSMTGETNDSRFIKKALRGVRTVMYPNVYTPLHASLDILAH
ncbi:hypothetical protein VNO78_12528 [Psophocarpus tetragonolobus]|uniref:Uncharacterized protein n=1 Tax=Psophocarpus tetragonolobus TaxID=3891 RepID=A0AAN9SP51_PSOTE